MCFALSAKFLLFPLMTCISNGSTPRFGDIMRCFCVWLRASCVNLKDYFTLWTPFVESVLKCLWIATNTIARGHNVYGQFFIPCACICHNTDVYFILSLFLSPDLLSPLLQQVLNVRVCLHARTHLHNEKPFFYELHFFFSFSSPKWKRWNQQSAKATADYVTGFKRQFTTTFFLT